MPSVIEQHLANYKNLYDTSILKYLPIFHGSPSCLALCV